MITGNVGYLLGPRICNRLEKCGAIVEEDFSGWIATKAGKHVRIDLSRVVSAFRLDDYDAIEAEIDAAIRVLS